jgi:cysteine dioxygenase
MNNLNELKDELIQIFNMDKDKYFENVKNALSKYNGNDWKKYIKINDKSYNRHLYYSSDEFDLIIITWSSGNKCKVHNHPENGCFVKIMDGNISEEYYDTKTLQKSSENKYTKNDIMYIDDTINYHRMCNNNDQPCITLHIYSPGNYVPTFFT